MTAERPASERPPAGMRPRVAVTGVVGGAPLLVVTRIALWVGVQLLLAGLVLLTGAAAAGGALNEAAGWWMVYGALVELGTLAVLIWLIRRAGVSYRSLLGPRATAWQVVLGVVGVLAATLPAVAFSSEVNKAFYGDATPPMFAVVDVPTAVGVFSALVVPLLAELVEPVVYLGILLPWLERRTGRSWLAAIIVVAVWAAEHAFYPLLLTDGRLDLSFAGYRVVSVLPFLAIWTALYYTYGRRLLPIMGARWIFNGGTNLAIALGAVG
jgi:Type II CAAX prenyl endopeptidase Rce1-like